MRPFTEFLPMFRCPPLGCDRVPRHSPAWPLFGCGFPIHTNPSARGLGGESGGPKMLCPAIMSALVRAWHSDRLAVDLGAIQVLAQHVAQQQPDRSLRILTRDAPP